MAGGRLMYNAGVGRRFFTFAAALSLLLCIATAGLWAWRSFSSRCVIGLFRGTYSSGQYFIATRRGEMFLQIEPYPQGIVVATTVDGRTVPANGPVPVIGNTRRPYFRACRGQRTS